MLAQWPHVATELFSKKVTKIRHENDSPSSEPVSIDHDYVKVNRKNDSEQFSDLGVWEIDESDKEEEGLKTLTELEDHCYSTVKSAHSIVNDVNDRNSHEHYSDLRVSETHDSGEEEDCLKTPTELDHCHSLLISDISIVSDMNYSINKEQYSDLRVSETQEIHESDEECLKTLTELAPTVLSELKKYEL